MVSRAAPFVRLYIFYLFSLLINLPAGEAGKGRRVGEGCSRDHGCYYLTAGGPRGYNSKVTCALPQDKWDTCRKNNHELRGTCKHDGSLEFEELGCEWGVKEAPDDTRSDDPGHRLVDLLGYYKLK